MSSHAGTAAQRCLTVTWGPFPTQAPVPTRPLRCHSTHSPGRPRHPAELSLGSRGSPGCAQQPRGRTQRSLTRPCPGTSSCSGSFSGDSGETSRLCCLCPPGLWAQLSPGALPASRKQRSAGTARSAGQRQRGRFVIAL